MAGTFAQVVESPHGSSDHVHNSLDRVHEWLDRLHKSSDRRHRWEIAPQITGTLSPVVGCRLRIIGLPFQPDFLIWMGRDSVEP